MKPQVCIISLLCSLLLLSACESIKRFTIEVQEPASVTIPVTAQNVLILNNTLPQPKNYGIEQYFDGKSVANLYPPSLDSAVWNTIQALSDVLSESDFFNNVSIYKAPIRTDDEWLSVTAIPEEIRNEFHEIEGYDVLITIDRLLFIVKVDAKKNMQNEYTTSERFIFSDIRVSTQMTCNVYLSGANRPLKTLLLSDSLISKGTISESLPVILQTIPTLMANDLSHRLGELTAFKLVPTWKETDRILFTSQKARIKEAYSYVTGHNWSKAESIWLSELEKHNKPVDRARISLNIAVANEMQDKLESALQWAEKAKEYYNSVDYAKCPEEIDFIKKYVPELQRRIQNNRLLDMQTGITE